MTTRTLAEIDAELLELLQQPVDDWQFLSTCVWTKDEASGSIRQFPAADPNFEYLQYLTGVRRQHNFFAIEKSRRMMVSWWLTSIYLFDTLTQPNHANFIVAKKLEDSAYWLGEERILGVYRRIPGEVWQSKPELQETGKQGKGYTLLSCSATGSYLQAVASGADQLRQYTASNVLFDEFAFQERQEEAWAAARPTVEGGGHIDVVSTPELGAYMYDLIHDDAPQVNAV